MTKLNPFFSLEGKTYEIKRTRYLECEYEKITERSSLTEEQERQFAEYIKLQMELEEITHKLKEKKEDYFEDVTNKDKKAQYMGFKELYDDKYSEVVNFLQTNKDFSTKVVEEKAYENGVKLLIVALGEQYGVDENQAQHIWETKALELGKEQAKEWIGEMIQSLFEKEEVEDAFLVQARAKREEKLARQKGLAKTKK